MYIVYALLSYDMFTQSIRIMYLITKCNSWVSNRRKTFQGVLSFIEETYKCTNIIDNVYQKGFRKQTKNDYFVDQKVHMHDSD